MKPLIRKFIKTMRHIDKRLFFATAFLFLFGLLNIVSASSRQAVSYEVPLYYYFYKQLQMLVFGFLASMVIIMIDTKKYRLLSLFAYIGISGLLIWLSVLGTTNRGSVNWISLPFIGRIQPSEFAKPVMIVCLALLFELFYKKLRNKKQNHYDMIAIILFVGLFFPAIIFFQKDLGTALIAIFIFGILFLASPILRSEKAKTIGLVLVLGLVMGSLYVAVSGKSLLSAEQLERFDYFNPCSNYEDGGYQICNAYIAINDGGLFGLGIGKSKQKYSYIPEPHTDSIFAIISEELGLLVSSMVFILYLYILNRILSLASRVGTIRGRYICLGIASYIFAHIFINLGGLFGLIPLTGVPLAFLSYGGSFTISLMIALAIVQRIHIEYKQERVRV